MKQFIVDRHTTPNTPTLEQVPTEKVPVYESLAAAESDLANLEEGQILATTDTGDELSQPVDVVESGNLHAVSSNAVAESLSYSTTEQKTGGVWIDGKPIYRKVVVDDTPTNNEVIATNVDNLISLGGFLLWANTAKYYLPWLTASGCYVGCKNENNSVYLQLDNTGSYVNKVWVILEYTKTTD